MSRKVVIISIALAGLLGGFQNCAPMKSASPASEALKASNEIADILLKDAEAECDWLNSIKGSMSTAALETKGTNRTQIGRLVWVQNYSVDVYGVPELFMAIVRSADMNKTPDVRTRAIFREWCMPATIQFVKPQMSEQAIMQLLSNGGIIVGIGDFRQEKGKGNFGQFSVVTEADCKDIIKNGGLKQQDAAIKTPVCFDSDTEELLGWFQEEVGARGKKELLSA